MFLCIDTATDVAGISLVSQEESVGYLPLEKNQHSDQILPKIDELIKKANIQLKDLQAILTITGPGSFTSLRVGITVANQFSHQLNIPIIGFTTKQWYEHRTDEKATYLQSMNRTEVFEGKITPIKEITEPVSWIGWLTDDHKAALPEGSKKIADLPTPDATWQKIAQETKLESNKTYDLLEPFYGKEPNITKSSRKLSIS